MKTRNFDWFDIEEMQHKFGFQVMHGGKWCNAHRDGVACIFDTEAERDAARAEARKTPAKDTPCA